MLKNYRLFKLNAFKNFFDKERVTVFHLLKNQEKI